ncbi:hypothetical protein Tco_0749179 [Tanacetum coccineum]|uniref:Reverse transcriptase domain-containing protein n=1 Tax=Tanacetum coccineum TaxID=301880 RepID=A0ABQ4Z0P2_9ASTR
MYFHVSNLKKCLSDEPLAIPLDEIHIDEKLNFIEEPVEIMDVKSSVEATSHSIVKIMAASAITISSDSSDESVGSPPSRVILFGDIPTVIPSTFVVAPETSTTAPIFSSAAPMVETTLVASPTGLCGLVPYSGSDSDSPDEMSSPEHISPLPAISPFLCTDSSEAPDSSDGPPSQDPHFSIAPVIAPPGIRRRSAILIRPGDAIPFGRPYRTHLNGPRKFLTARKIVGPLPARRLACRHASPRSSNHRPSSSSSSSDSSPVHSSGLDAPDQTHSGSSTRVYIADFDPEEDEEDPEEDPADYHVDGGDNDDNESSDYDDDDDDVEKDEEDEEEDEHLALTDPSAVPTDDYACIIEFAAALPSSSLPPSVSPPENIKFYHSLEVKRDEDERPYIEFKLVQFTFELDLSQLSRIFQTPKALETFYTRKWLLDSLDDHPNSRFFGPKHDLVKKNITIHITTQTQLQRDPNKLHIEDIHPELRG